MSGARSRLAGRLQRARRIQGQVALIFLALGSIGSFLLGHEIAADLAVRAIYSTASQDQLTYSPVTLRAPGAVGASVSVRALRSGAGSSARRRPPSGGGRAHVQSPSGKSGQAHSGLSGILASQGLTLGWIATGAESSPGVPLTNPLMPVPTSPVVASSPAEIALNGNDDAAPTGSLQSCPSPSTDQVGDETPGRPCMTAPGAPLSSASLAIPQGATVDGSET